MLSYYAPNFSGQDLDGLFFCFSGPHLVPASMLCPKRLGSKDMGMIHKTLLDIFCELKIERAKGLPVVGDPTSLLSGTASVYLIFFHCACSELRCTQCCD